MALGDDSTQQRWPNEPWLRVHKLTSGPGKTGTPPVRAPPPMSRQGALGALGTTKINKAEVNDMGGSLKVHIRLNIEVDVRVIAKVKGDIAIGIL
jgi:hypothetical protein